MKHVRTFLPVLVFYFLYIVFFAKNDLSSGDEGRYFIYAKNLLNGCYMDPVAMEITNGPGYPFLLVPFVFLKAPPIFPKLLLNSLFIFGSVVFLFKALSLFIPHSRAIFFAYLLGAYYPLLRVVHLNMTEPLTLFLVCAFLFFSLRYLKEERFRFRGLLLPSFLFGYLILTRVIFGDVALVGFLLFFLISFLFRQPKSRQLAYILALGFLISTPYLIHNYLVTGRLFYWGSEGGSQLYWMSSHKDKEYGSWFSNTVVLNNKIPEMDSSHIALYQSIDTLNGLEKNDRMMEKAIENIKKDPKSYLLNIPPNILRLFFGYPVSYRQPSYAKLYFYLLPNAFLLVPLLLSFIPAWYNRDKIPFEIVSMMILILIYLGGTILVFADPRYIIPVIPFFLLWLGFMYSRIIKISYR